MNKAGIEPQPQTQQQHAEGEEKENGDAPSPYCGFSITRRRFIVGIVSAAGFLGPLAGGIYLPALPVLKEDFSVGSAAINSTVAVFMALRAFVPLFWSALADWKGRRPLYIISLVIYIVANVLMATLPANFGAFLFLRMVQAFGCSSVISLGAGTIADVTEAHRMGSAMSVFLLGPNLSPTIGPVLGGIITGQKSWRWTFGILAIIVGLVWTFIFLALPETLRSRVGSGRLYANTSFLLWPPRLASPLAQESERGPSPPKPSVAAFWRLFSYPPISISSIYTALLFASYFSIAVDLPGVLVNQYQWSITAVGGGYVALGVSIIMGSLSAGRLSDWRRAQMAKASNNDHVEPEGRLVDQMWGTILCAAGCLMYGWCVDRNIHPAVVLLATFLNGFGMSSVLVVTFAFLTECAPQAAAGVMALENMLRNPAAAIASVITPPLIAKMGAGWFFSGFALVCILSAGIGSLLLSLYGPSWRGNSAIAPAQGFVSLLAPRQVTESLPLSSSSSSRRTKA